MQRIFGRFKRAKIGLTGKFYLSALGTVAAFEGQGAKRDNLEYGYLIYADVEGGISSNAYLNCLPQRAEFKHAGADTSD